MNVIELFINSPVNAKLDVDGALPIAIQYQVADIRDISKRNAAYSKTLVLPGTKNNNYWFGNLFDINSDFTMFNPNRKTDAKLLVNGEIVIDGFLQLRKINKVTEVDFSGNQIQYECVIYNNFIDLMSELGEQTLYELDLSEYGHTFSVSAITQSWSHTYEDGYVYPMTGTDDKDYKYNIQYFKPAAFYRAIFDKILSIAGYGWTGSFLNNEQFKREIITYVRDGNILIQQNEKDRREYRATVTTNATQSVGNLTNALQIGTPILPFNDDINTPNFDNDNRWDTTLYEWSIDRNGLYDLTYKAEFQVRVFNNSVYSATNDGYGGGTGKTPVALKFTPIVQKWNGLSWSNLAVGTPIGATGPYNPTTNPAVNEASSLTLPQTIFAGTTYSTNVLFPITTLSNLQLYQGQKVRIYIKAEKTSVPNSPGYSQGTLNPGNNAHRWNITSTNRPFATFNVTFAFPNSNTYIFNSAHQSEIVQGDNVDLGTFLPEKIKQKDLISDLIKRYNLYIQTDPDNERLLVIDERPNYYDDNVILDWTFKKDYNVPENVELLSELQFKSMIFKWTDDDDIYNKAYREATGDSYGQYEYIFDNDFVKGQKDITSPFSPTPIVKTQFGAFLAAIDPIKPKIKPRILYWGGLISGVSWQMYYQNLSTGATVSSTFTSYPYSGHWDDPINPTLDINFGGPKFLFYNDFDTITQNNMYNTYWSNYISQIEDGRLLTANFALDETDIRFIKDNFNAKIFIKDSYYYVNKIFDYNPLINGTTKVELIKINDGIKWTSGGGAITQGIWATSGCPVDLISKKIGMNYFWVSQSGQQVTQACCDAIGGIYSTASNSCQVKNPVISKPTALPNAVLKNEMIGTGNVGKGIFFGNENTTIEVTKSIQTPDGTFSRLERQFVFGDYNTITADNVVVEGGDFNEVNSTNTAILIGSSNQISGSDNLILNSSANIVEGSVNNLISVFGSTVSSSNALIMNSSGVSTTQSGVVIFGATDLVATQSNTIYLGNHFSINVDTGDFVYGTMGTTASGLAGTSGTSGLAGTSGTSGLAGTSGTSGTSPNQNLQQTLTLGNSAGTYSIQFPAGSATSPSVTIQSNLTTGLYAPTTAQLAVTNGGTQTTIFTNEALYVNNKIYNAVGTVLLPTYTFQGDTNTGMYRAGADSVGISVGGAGNLIVDSLRVTVPTGSIPNPSLVFSGENTTGISRPGPAQVGISIVGATAAIFNSSGLRLPGLTSSLIAVNSIGQIIATSSGGAGTSGTSGIAGTSGTSGINGVDGPSTFRFVLSGITQGVNPGTSSFTIDSTTSTTASVIYVNRYDYLGRDIQSWITTTLNEYASNPVYLQLSQAGTQNWSAYEITSYGAYSGGEWFSFNVSLLGGFATHSVGETYSIGLIKNGASGTSGTSGGAGSLQQTLTIGNTSSFTINLEEGSVTNPSYTFQSFSQSGLYHSFQHPVTSRVGIAVSGATSALFKSNSMAIPDGQLLQPGLHFIDDVDTGLYRNTTNEMSIVVGGMTAATFYDGVATAGIKIPSFAGMVFTNTSVNGIFTQSLSDYNFYAYTLNGNATFSYSNATQSVYNFMIKAGTYSFTLNSASNWQTVGATALGYTGSFVMSMMYDGTDMWVSATRNYQSY